MTEKIKKGGTKVLASAGILALALLVWKAVDPIGASEVLGMFESSMD